MSRKRSGSLFEQLLSKSPAAADKLKQLAGQVRPQQPKPIPDPPKRPSQQSRLESNPLGMAKAPNTKGRWFGKKKKAQPAYSPAGRSLEAIERAFNSAGNEIKRNAILISCRAYLRHLSVKAKTSHRDRKRFTSMYNLVGRMEASLAGTKKTKPAANPVVTKAKTGPPSTPTVAAAKGTRQPEPVETAAESQVSSTGQAPDPADQAFFQSASQFDSAKDGRPCDLIIGLDFGTACTKVILHSPYEQQAAFAVPFEPFNHESNLHLLPTHISIGTDGGYFLPRTGSPGASRDLKLKMLADLSKMGTSSATSHEPTSNQEAAIAYLALVLRFARTWFLSNQADVYRHLRLVWQLNLGVPSATFDEADINRLYERVGQVAWAVSVKDGPITSQAIAEVWAASFDKLTSQDPDTPVPEVTVMPEIVAEVVGYARSDLRQRGVHLMVDVGAGTLDVCGFILHEDEGLDKFGLLTTDVQHLGAARLDQLRRETVRKGLEDHIEGHCNLTDPVAPITADMKAYVPEPGPLLDRLADAQAKFAELCMQRIRGVVVTLKARRDPLSEAWDDLLPVFMCGGGRDASPHRELPNQIGPWIKEYAGNKGIRQIDLPKPDNLRAKLDNDQYHRLAVAWGLSQPAFDIGMTTPPSDIDDIDPNDPTGGGAAARVPWWRNSDPFVSKDQV